MRALLASASMLVLLGVPQLVQGSATAQESTAWSQYQGDPAHTGYAPDGPQPPFRVRWTLPAPAGIALSGAVVEGNIAVTVGEEAVYGVDVATGQVAWQIPRAGGRLSIPAIGTDTAGKRVLVYVEGPATAVPGASSPGASPTSSPSPTEATASPSPSPSTAGDETNVSSVVAVALGNQKELWRTPLEGLSRSGVTIEGGSVYVGDQEVGAQDVEASSGRVYALSLDDGSIIWKQEVGGRADTSIAVADGNAYVVARDSQTPRVIIAAFDAATGERSWSPLSLQVSSTAGSAPTAGGGSLFLGSADRRLRALDASNGAERWSALVLSVFSPATALAFDGSSVYAADVSGGLYALDVADGARRWSFHVNETVLRSAPVVSGSSMLVGLANGSMVAIDIQTGHLVWRSPVTPGLIGSIALAGDTVIAVKGGRNAGLIAFEHDPDGTLLDEPSPTRFEAATSLSRWLIAAVLVFGIALALGVLAGRRFGRSGETDDAEVDVDEDVDAYEDEDAPDDEEDR